MSRQDAKSAKNEPCLDVDTLARSVIGAAIEVHRHLGPGYLEGVYEAALALEFDIQAIFLPKAICYASQLQRAANGAGKG